VKGQIIRLDQSRMPLVDHVVRTPEMYLAPKSNGTLVLGASAEDRGFDASITAGPIFELLRAAWECVPGIYELPIIETTVGFRPATIDHAPLLGEWGIEGVVLATGYYRHGILFAPYAARLIVEQMVGGNNNHWLMTFSPERFHAVGSER
jgi:glycine oxidase